MEAHLDRYNSFISSNAKLNLFLADEKMVKLQKGNDHDYDEFGYSDSEPSSADLASPTRLYRVFNDGRFDHGGRFYGGWWQSIRKDYRRFITINGRPTVEVDFSSMQLAMLYAQVGRQLEGDAYVIDGFGPEVRPLVKTTTLKMINAPGGIRSPLKSALPEGISWKGLQEAILARHKAIAEFFGSGEGIRLQRLDSDIAEEVIMTMMDKGIPVLPIHDSFIVAEGHAEELSATMVNAYQRRMRGRAISLKRSPSLFDELLAGQEQLSINERHNVALRLFLAKRETPDYEGYRLREELLDRARSGVSARTTEVWPLGQTESTSKGKFPTTGPRLETSYFGMRGSLNPAKRLWDRFMSRR
ncbi:hypothetical protein CIT25_35010 [Mesorhizobium mediterraneum]|uniref:Uncharacterized protein n=2 Tax=Mesorhizobium mediterraneum TaxID=43617 RepID=A0AB36QZF5_9HYPH|nr:hypothetical protein CIT25_35010 [Mesorhizobium mediterraneum]